MQELSFKIIAELDKVPLPPGVHVPENSKVFEVVHEGHTYYLIVDYDEGLVWLYDDEHTDDFVSLPAKGSLDQLRNYGL